MSRRFIPLLCFTLLSLPALAQNDAAEPPTEQVLVVGQKPGPGMWKVSKGEHVLWVFGSYGPLPKKMEWRSHEVEAVMAQSQELLTEPGAKLAVGWLRGMTLLPFAIGVKDNPNGEHLRDLVPADTYERWLVLKKKYLGNDNGIEGQRPVFAANELFGKAMQQAGLTTSSEVRDRLLALAKTNRLKVTAANVDVKVDSPVSTLREFKKAPMDDVACFTKTIERLETDLDAMRVRANAWAKGDIDVIRKLNYQDSSCTRAWTQNAMLRERGFNDMDNRVREKWIVPVETALIANKSTVAIVPIRDILATDGYLAALAERGYKVEQPE